MKKKLLIIGIVVMSLSVSGCVSRNLGVEENGGEKRKTTDIIDDARDAVGDTNKDIDENNKKIESLEGN